jgi:hypothetical protein
MNTPSLRIGEQPLVIKEWMHDLYNSDFKNSNRSPFDNSGYVVFSEASRGIWRNERPIRVYINYLIKLQEDDEDE